MKRFPAVLLSVLMALGCLLSPALAAQEPAFFDVDPEAWYAPYIDVCVEAGVMEGVGDGRFAPEGELTWEECVILSLRLHSVLNGGDGSFPPAPIDWNYAVLALEDRTPLYQGYIDSDAEALHWCSLGLHVDTHLGFDLENEEARAWGLPLDGRAATLSVNGASYAGSLHLTTRQDLLFFSPDLSLFWDDPQYQYASFADIVGLSTFIPGEPWCRDGWYYAQQNGLERLVYNSNARWGLAERLAEITDLPAINEVSESAIPDLEPKLAPGATLELYRAGVLIGVDGHGRFDPWGIVTRAEAATMVARVLRPELRWQFSLPKPEAYPLGER